MVSNIKLSSYPASFRLQSLLLMSIATFQLCLANKHQLSVFHSSLQNIS